MRAVLDTADLLLISLAAWINRHQQEVLRASAPGRRDGDFGELEAIVGGDLDPLVQIRSDQAGSRARIAEGQPEITRQIGEIQAPDDQAAGRSGNHRSMGV